ncbi:DUF5926 family protein [Nocardioides sp.]|uniref:DUF5926 family protein n=1 Tax=Nocardioides sp. TaxID=35761 RepID=UPI003D133B72
MGKSSRTKARNAAATPLAEGEVGPRQPCPCGSGRRYKACHGDPSGQVQAYVGRPFEGLDSECDLVALRELVPSATAPLTLTADGAPAVTLCSLLPGAAPALVRDNGEVWLGLQVQHNFGDPSRDLGAVLEKALAASAAQQTGVVGLTENPGSGPRLQDLVTADALDISVHDGFGFWIADAERTPEMEAALEQANGAALPTSRLASVEAAYWTSVGTKEHLRWVMPEPEDALLDALSRLHAARDDSIAEGSRLVGMFRAHGVLTPVWDLPLGTGAEVLEEAAADFRQRLQEALDDDSDLSTAQRSARAGLANRQVTIR